MILAHGPAEAVQLHFTSPCTIALSAQLTDASRRVGCFGEAESVTRRMRARGAWRRHDRPVSQRSIDFGNRSRDARMPGSLEHGRVPLE